MGNFASPGVCFFSSHRPKRPPKRPLQRSLRRKALFRWGPWEWDCHGIFCCMYIYIYTYVTYVCVYTLVPKYEWLLWMLHHTWYVYIYIHQMLFIQLELFKGWVKHTMVYILLEIVGWFIYCWTYLKLMIIPFVSTVLMIRFMDISRYY